MKALTLNGYDGLASMRMADVPDPQPRPRDVVVRVKAASVNPVDGKISQGYARARLELAFPFVLGRDCSGVVISAGADVREFSPGDEIWAVADQARWGTHAELVAIDVSTVARKPPGIDHAGAASIAVAGLSAYAGIVATGQVQKGQKVLIHAGAGGVGSLAVQMAKHLGATVAATAGPKNQDHLRSLGADLAVDYTRGLDAAGSGYDLVFDLIGGDVRFHSFPLLKPGGAIVHISVPPMTQPPPRSDVSVKPAPVKYDAALLDRLAEMIARGALLPQIGARFAFADILKAYEHVMTGHARGKAVVTFG